MLTVKLDAFLGSSITLLVLYIIGEVMAWKHKSLKSSRTMRKLSMRQRKSMSQKRRTEDRPIPEEKSEIIDESNEDKLKAHLNTLDNELLQLSDITVSDYAIEEGLDGLDDDEITDVQEKAKKRKQDEAREEKLASIEAELEAKLAAAQEEDKTLAEELIEKINHYLQSISGQKEGLTAIRQLDLKALQAVIERVRDTDIINILRTKYTAIVAAELLADDLEAVRDRGLELIRRQKELDEMLQEISEMKGATIAEIKSFAQPVPEVFAVMKATYILLGEDEDTMENWSAIRSMMCKTGKNSIRRRIQDFDIKSLRTRYRAVKDAKILCQPQSLATVREASLGAGTFFSWCMVTLNAVDALW